MQLREAFAVAPSSAIGDRGLRNSIEHFDERMDLYLHRAVAGMVFPSLVLEAPEDEGIAHHIVRAYYLRDGIFQILGERFQIEPIIQEVLRIHTLLVEMAGGDASNVRD